MIQLNLIKAPKYAAFLTPCGQAIHISLDGVNNVIFDLSELKEAPSQIRGKSFLQQVLQLGLQTSPPAKGVHVLDAGFQRLGRGG